MQFMYAFNKASRVMGTIKRTIRFKDTRVMLSLYKTLVSPHVELNIVLPIVPGIHTVERTRRVT